MLLAKMRIAGEGSPYMHPRQPRDGQRGAGLHRTADGGAGEVTMSNVKIVSTESDLFVEFAGIRIAKRGRPGTAKPAHGYRWSRASSSI
jgi:hypothetical protein